MKIVSWNVNGIVACRRKGFLRFLSDVKPDIVCCQEIKTQCPLNTPGYEQFWNPSQERGKSGTLILAKQPPLSWSTGFGIDRFDCEGRLITLERFALIARSAPLSPPWSSHPGGAPFVAIHTGFVPGILCIQLSAGGTCPSSPIRRVISTIRRRSAQIPKRILSVFIIWKGRDANGTKYQKISSK